ncbi:methyl-accepting chemotaxis protein [Sporomusa sp. KB1]|uniref:methyl-accepting chemotaxis protein n=1 Tax=Sporomusa sp. KB1 TaxID=943346 RepID=UPI00119EC59A|nr:methyl-accepting chemotaxis protein [Sporomusa sp. KB1]TWH46727.1 methyl-accepting chemotaxis protein [Sporomusa sp. KB1]
MSLKKKLTLIFSVLSIVILLVSSIAGYMFTKEQVLSGIQAEMTSTVNAHVNKLDGWLIGKAKMLEITAGTLQSSVGDNEISVPMLAGYKTVDKEISDMYFASVAGQLVDGSGWNPPAGYDPRTRSWYKSGLEQGKLAFGEPYLDGATKQMVVPVVMPYKGSTGQLRGIMAQDIQLQILVDNIQSINLKGQGYAYLFDAKGFMLAHPDKEIVSKNIFEEDKLKDMSAYFKEMIGKEQGFAKYSENGEVMLVVYQKVPSTGWTLAINIPEKIVLNPLEHLQWLLLMIAMLAVIIVVAVTFVIVKRIVNPIEVLAGQVDLVASGDLTVQSQIDGQDEIGKLATGFNKMVHNLRNLIVQVSTNAQQVAASSEELTASAQESAQASNQVAGSVTEIAAGAERQLAAVGQTASVVEKMTASIQQVGDGAKQAAATSLQAAEKAKESGTSIGKAVTQMGLIEKTVNTSAEVVADLGERSKEIGQIVDTIAGIAGQTNLLALNAAIEAARAGEQGRGFAVVAEEVRKLAEQSQDAAKKIADLIGEIQRETAKAVSAMDNGTREVSRGAAVINVAGIAFQEIEEMVVQVSNQITEISTAMQQMEIGSQQIVSSVKVIDDLSKMEAGEAQTVSAATEEQSASMQEIAASSQTLAKMAEELQRAIQQFKV